MGADTNVSGGSERLCFLPVEFLGADDSPTGAVRSCVFSYALVAPWNR